ncbi:phosphate acetyltransferase [Sedimenticola sp.]|uniref:phosphate acetyltransferase n=1 Tax=Sedimenticola sp. TaxID=1940285 RepID=UPI003D0ED4DB
MLRSIYIAGAEPGSGKSVVVLGMMEMLTALTKRVGFFRPIIPENGGSDDLTHLITERYGIDLPTSSLYGCTDETARNLLAEGRYDELLKQVMAKYKAVEQQMDMVVCAGTDFSDVTSAMELDFNADLANNLGCLLLPVIKGYGRSAHETVDAVRVLEESLNNRGCELLAAIVNRVDPDNIEQVSAELTVSAIPTLPFYVLPEHRTLEKPTVGEIARSLNIACLSGDQESLNHEVSHYKIAAMEVPNFLDNILEDSLIITPGDRSDIILTSLAADASSRYPKIAGLLLTGGLTPAPQVTRLLEGLSKSRVAILSAPWDTFSTALKVNEVEGSILPSDERKIAAGLGIVEKYINGEELKARISLSKTRRKTPLMFEYELIQRAKSARKHIVLPEGFDERILRAAEILLLREVVEITLLGSEEKIRQRISQLGLNLNGVKMIDPQTSVWRRSFADTYFRLRRHKGISEQMAYDAMADVSYFGTMMIHHGYADGMVSGAAHTTQHTIRPAFEIIRTKPGCSLVSSVFFMCLEDKVLVYGDCAINPNPNAAQLADIAISSAATAAMFGIEPRVAMLSYSTGVSGKGDDVDSVREAVTLARRFRPDLKLEGPIQYDAAIDPDVAHSKMPESEVAGQATVFIFPDLNTGNNTYKAVQRSANAVAIGPVIQGLNKPVNDLSRGCSVTDIVNTVAITAIQAQENDSLEVKA